MAIAIKNDPITDDLATILIAKTREWIPKPNSMKITGDML